MRRIPNPPDILPDGVGVLPPSSHVASTGSSHSQPLMQGNLASVQIEDQPSGGAHCTWDRGTPATARARMPCEQH